MNAKKVRAINDEYDRLEGTVTREVTTTLWDRVNNCHYVARCVVIDLGRRPPVTPYALTAEDRELMRLRGAIHQPRKSVPTQLRSTETFEALSKRLLAWMEHAGAVTIPQTAQALNVSTDQAKQLLISNARLWKKIAGQSYFVGVSAP